MCDAFYLVSLACCILFELRDRLALLATLDQTKLAVNPDIRPLFEYKKR